MKKLKRSRLHFIITPINKPDTHGRQSYDIEWTNDGRKYAQCQRAVIADIVDQIRARGHDVTVRDLVEANAL